MRIIQQYQKLLQSVQEASDDDAAAKALERANDLAVVIIISELPMDQKLPVMLGYCAELDHDGTMVALRDLANHAQLA